MVREEVHRQSYPGHCLDIPEYKNNKFEMFQTIISFINLIPPVLHSRMYIVQYLKLKPRYNLQTRH